jgi:hypothetical protein
MDPVGVKMTESEGSDCDEEGNVDIKNSPKTNRQSLILCIYSHVTVITIAKIAD